MVLVECQWMELIATHRFRCKTSAETSASLERQYFYSRGQDDTYGSLRGGHVNVREG